MKQGAISFSSLSGEPYFCRLKPWE